MQGGEHHWSRHTTASLLAAVVVGWRRCSLCPQPKHTCPGQLTNKHSSTIWSLSRWLSERSITGDPLGVVRARLGARVGQAERACGDSTPGYYKRRTSNVPWPAFCRHTSPTPSTEHRNIASPAQTRRHGVAHGPTTPIHRRPARCISRVLR
jgi:hypothetical protein